MSSPWSPALLSSTLLAATLAACASGDGDPPRRSETPAPADDPTLQESVAAGPTRASTEAARGEEADDDPEVTTPPPASTATLTVAPFDADRGEDGHGAQIPATDPARLDVQREGGFPGRAVDPVLHVGALRFLYYEHVGGDVLRFIVADRAALPEEAEIFVQWGDDERSRIDVAPTLAAPSSEIDL
jgi:hypothetical protein